MVKLLLLSKKPAARARTDALRAAHPGFGTDVPHPMGEGRDVSEILDNVLFTDPARRNDAAGRQCDGRTKDGLRHEDAFGVVAKRAVPEVRRDLLAGIEPVMDRQIVAGRPTPLLHGGERIMIGMRHCFLLQNTCWVYSEVSMRSLKLSVIDRSTTSKRKSP